MFDNLDNKNIELLPHKDDKEKGKKKTRRPRQVEYSKPTQTSSADQVQFLHREGNSWFDKIKSFFGRKKSSGLAKPLPQLDPVQKIKKTSSPLSKLYQKKLQSSVEIEQKKSVASQADNSTQIDKEPDSNQPPASLSKKKPDKEDIKLSPEITATSNNSAKQPKSPRLHSEDNQRNNKVKKDKIVGFQYDINLIREEFVPVIDKKKMFTTFALTSLLSILLVVFVYFLVDFIKFGRTRKIKELEVSLQRVEQTLAQKQKDLVEVTDYYQTVSQIKSLLDQHIYWTNLLEFIEENTLTTVYYDSIRATKSGTISLSAKAKDYESVRQQFLVFKNHPAVVKVEINNASIDGEARGEIMEKVLNAVIQGSGSTSTPTSTITTFSEQQRILRDTLQRLPIEFNISLVVKPELFLRDNQGRPLIETN